MNSFFEDTDKRWIWLSSIVSLVLLLSLPVFVGSFLFGYAVVVSLNQSWFVLYSIAILASLVYVFGQDTLRTVYRWKNGGFDHSDDE